MRSDHRVDEGAPEPLGVTLTPTGINVAVWSLAGTAVEFCLFDPTGEREAARILLPGRAGPVFHGHIQGVGEGARYGLRVHGPFDPARGDRFNPHKLLVDPYALALDRPFVPHPAMFAYDPGNPEGGDSFDDTDSAAVVPKGIVTTLDMATPPPPSRPWGETVVYELHVRGFTRTHPDVPPPLRGTFAGLAHPAAIAHLQRLGVTAVELMPAAAWIDERHLALLGLTNHWGYNPVAYLAPDPRLAPGGWAEVRAAVDALAASGIETIQDVVLNHTGEGDALGPTLSLRGLDNAAYYRLAPKDRATYLNDAGTGATLALNRAPALRLAMDTLRAWRRLGGVAGFRFDLATVLGRGPDGFDARSPLLAAIGQDPELRVLKLIAEPWDVGPGGYQLGGFPPAWAEWNDRFRDTVRGFWRGDGVSLGEVAARLSGSRDVFAGRGPTRGVNFVVSHDGFTLADLVAYQAKHNLANGEANRDGADHNLSWNNGVEGPTLEPAVARARLADQRALLATLLLARGTPMLAMGSEIGHSQGGNNNPYAQDNAASWLDWAHADPDLLAFTARLTAIRRDHPALRADRFLTGLPEGGGIYPDVAWRNVEGEAPTTGDWDDPAGETLAMVLSEAVADAHDRVVLAIHRARAPGGVVLPEPRDGFAWTILADSADPARTGPADGGRLVLGPRSVTVLAEAAAPDRRPRGVDDAVLARLAAAAGVAQEWSGVDGRRHAVRPDTQAALLAAMGLPAATSHQALESLHALAEDHDRRPLPFVLTGRERESVTVPLTAAGPGLSNGAWLTLEGDDGRVARLRALPADDAEGSRHCRDGRIVRRLQAATPPLPAGDYSLRRDDRPDHPCRLIIAPATCHIPAPLAGDDRLWGLSAQIYSLRRTGDQGVGDFTTLGALGEAAGRRGASLLAINPLHALFPGDRRRASPYSPSDRRFLDPLYLDLNEIPFAGDSGAAAAPLVDLPTIDYPKVWALKAAALETGFAHAPDDPGFASFVARGGETLRRFALFQAISETLPDQPWPSWPAGLRDPNGEDALAFAAAHIQRLRFHQHLQWLCEGQLARAAQRASGMPIGLCRDLAVGAAPDGAEIWASRGLVAAGVSIGAPPDPFGPRGQVWGLPPFDPHRLAGDAYRAMSTLFAANMRHAGALRIDHVMGLGRQFWVPHGAEGADGAYVSYPLDDLLAVLALESGRARCLVIGEDLGVVADGFRETLSRAGVYGYRVLPFERDDDGFLPPARWPRRAMACASTHDLPPLAGWWEGADIDERQSLGLTTDADSHAAHAVRRRDKDDLLLALVVAGLAAPGDDVADPLGPEIAAALHGFVAASGAALALAQVEDLVGERVAVNLPGTDRERPNWRRRIAPTLEQLFESPLAHGIVNALRAARPDADPAA